MTECNAPVYVYSQQRAKEFARQRHTQLLWVQAEDSPPAEHFGHYTKNELEKLKERWLTATYHARRTEGIQGLLPLCHDMPLRVTLGNGDRFKEFGIHNGARCRLKAWTLHGDDEQHLATAIDSEIVLAHMPTILWVQMERELPKPYPGAPPNLFPMKPLSNDWCLDKDDQIHIRRRGFPVVPDFSSTVHLATGRTMRSSIADIGTYIEKPHVDAAMRAYIAISRTTDAEGLLILRPFSPTLFGQGPQPWPNLLMQVLQEAMPLEALHAATTKVVWLSLFIDVNALVRTVSRRYA